MGCLGIGGVGPVRERRMLTAYIVHGGYRIADVEWFYDQREEAYDERSSFQGLDPTIYPTKEACEQAIEQQHGKAAA